MVAGAVLADPEPMQPRTRRASIALALTACVPADQSSHCQHVNEVKGGKLSYMALALEREPKTYRSLLMVARAILADPKPILPRLVRGCIALAFTACVPADQSSHCQHASAVKRERRAQLHGTGVRTRANCVQIATDGDRGGHGRP